MMGTGHMCFVTACAAGNWGMEAAEAWLVTLYLEFAGYPETIYISNPDLANNIHSVRISAVVDMNVKDC
jgi:hypothetical protein